jgi:hypothetical protein
MVSLVLYSKIVKVALDDPSSKENTQKGDEPMRESHLDDITDPKSSRERVASLGGGSVEKIAGEDGEKVDIVTGTLKNHCLR